VYWGKSGNLVCERVRYAKKVKNHWIVQVVCTYAGAVAFHTV